MINKLLLQLELQALSSADDSTLQYKPTNLDLADLLRHIRLYKEIPLEHSMDTFYSFYKDYKEGVLHYVVPYNKLLANCKGYGTDFDQAYIDYCEKLAAKFKLTYELRE